MEEDLQKINSFFNGAQGVASEKNGEEVADAGDKKKKKKKKRKK